MGLIWFVWVTPAVPKPPPPLSIEEAMAISNMFAEHFESLAPEDPQRLEFLAAIKRRDEIEEYERNPPPFVPVPNIPVEYERDGLTWGRLEASGHMVCRIRMTEPSPSWLCDTIMNQRQEAMFLRRAYRGGGAGWIEVFVHEALDPGKVTYIPDVQR